MTDVNGIENLDEWFPRDPAAYRSDMESWAWSSAAR